MSTTIKSIYGKEWAIRKGPEAGQVTIIPDSGSGDRVFRVDNLLDALKAEGLLEGEFVKPVEVAMNRLGVLRAVEAESHHGDTPEYHEWLAGLAISRAAYWRKERARIAETEVAAHALQCRRDDLVNQLFFPDSWQSRDVRYATVMSTVKRAVDRIIELEDAPSAK